MKLDIPFVSQTGNKTRNDCGAACLASLVGLPLDDVLASVKHPPNVYMSVNDILRGLRHFGLHGFYARPLTLPAVREALAMRYPVVVLVHYGVLPQPVRVGSFRGAHWVLITGKDDDALDIFVHDPLHPTDGHRRWPAAALDEAMRSRNTSNLPQQGIIVKHPYPVRQEAAAAFQQLSAELNQTSRQMREALAIQQSYLQQIYNMLGVEGEGETAQGLALSAILRLMGGR